MTQEERQQYINKLDEELFLGGTMLSEWSTLLIRDADTAFCYGANLSTILVAQAAIESHLRFEYVHAKESRKASFYSIIENAPIPDELKANLHKLRIYRNKWIHVNDPYEDEELLDNPEYFENELEEMATFAIRALREVIYLDQFV